MKRTHAVPSFATSSPDLPPPTGTGTAPMSRTTPERPLLTMLTSLASLAALSLLFLPIALVASCIGDDLGATSDGRGDRI